MRPTIKENAASSKSPMCPTNAYVITVNPEVSTRLTIATAAMPHMTFDSNQNDPLLVATNKSSSLLLSVSFWTRGLQSCPSSVMDDYMSTQMTCMLKSLCNTTLNNFIQCCSRETQNQWTIYIHPTCSKNGINV